MIRNWTYTVFKVNLLKFTKGQAYKGKYNHDKCQRYFICKEKSHNKIPTKKHVLICHEHRQNNENQQLPQEYNEK